MFSLISFTDSGYFNYILLARATKKLFDDRLTELEQIFLGIQESFQYDFVAVPF